MREFAKFTRSWKSTFILMLDFAFFLLYTFHFFFQKETIWVP